MTFSFLDFAPLPSIRAAVATRSGSRQRKNETQPRGVGEVRSKDGETKSGGQLTVCLPLISARHGGHLVCHLSHPSLLACSDQGGGLGWQNRDPQPSCRSCVLQPAGRDRGGIMAREQMISHGVHQQLELLSSTEELACICDSASHSSLRVNSSRSWVAMPGGESTILAGPSSVKSAKS
jgi:hypothetical protein